MCYSTGSSQRLYLPSHFVRRISQEAILKFSYLYMFRFVYKIKNHNNISLVAFLKIRHIGYSIPNIFFNLILFSLHAAISVQALRIFS